MNAWDQALFLWLNGGLQAAPAAAALARLLAVFGPALAAFGLAALCWRADARTRRDGLQVLASVALAMLAAWAIRRGWPQPRPSVLGLGTQLLEHGRGAGFPSSHATACFAAAFACLLHREMRSAGWVLAGLAAAVGWSRVALGVHFPLDVAGAALVAAAAAAAVHAAAGLARRLPARVTSSLPAATHRDAAPLWAVTLAWLALALLWDAGGLDLAVAGWGAGPQGFALRDHWATSGLLHEGGRLAAFGMFAWVAVSIAWPAGAMVALARRERIGLLLAATGAMLLVSLVKNHSLSSCPWDLAQFGGKAAYVPHWAWGLADGGPGRCFPAGHASAGFAWVAGFFAFRRSRPGVARLWLAGALLAGLAMGVAQQLRGAHYMSHTLWTGWICWAWCWACACTAGWVRRLAIAMKSIAASPCPVRAAGDFSS